LKRVQAKLTKKYFPNGEVKGVDGGRNGIVETG